MKQTLNRTLCSLLAAAALAAGLSACAPLVVGGAVVGTMMAVDRRTTGTQVEDEGIELRSANRLSELLGDRGHVNVTSFNRQVLLTGEVPSAQDRQRVEQVVLGVENVRSVVNDLAVMPPTSLGQRSNDTFITGKVRASLVDAKDLSASALQRATEIARGVSGVSKVVRVFEMLTEEELRNITPAPVVQDAPPASTPRN